MSIEARLRGAARQVKGVTIWRTTKGQWQASMTIDGTGWVCETDDDLPTALARLLARYAQAGGTGTGLIEEAVLQRRRMTERLTCD